MQPPEHLATTKLLAQEKENVVTIQMVPTTAIRQDLKEYGSLALLASLEVHASLNTPGCTIAKTLPMLTTTAASSKVNGNKETKKLRNAPELTI